MLKERLGGPRASNFSRPPILCFIRRKRAPVGGINRYRKSPRSS